MKIAFTRRLTSASSTRRSAAMDWVAIGHESLHSEAPAFQREARLGERAGSVDRRFGRYMLSAMNRAMHDWVDDIQRLTTPDSVSYCDGSDAEQDRLIRECLATGELIELNQHKMPGCYLHRSAPHDVARTEHLTFISTADQEEAGPTNNWIEPHQAKAKLTPLFSGAMK